MKLLIVDDELWSRRLIRGLLPWGELGFDDLFEAENGTQAIRLLEQYPIDLMITDMRMPGMDGASLLEYTHDKGLNLEIVVMSGYEDYKYLHAALKTKAIDYLLKPVVKEELKAAVLTGVRRINENKAVQYAEKLSIQTNMKEEINQYHLLRLQIVDAVMCNDVNALDKTTTKLIQQFLTNNQQPELVNYIISDLRQTISEMEREHNLQIPQETILTPTDIKDKLLRLVAAINQTDGSQQLSVLGVQKYIGLHLTEPLTLSILANRFHVSKEHLSRLFKQNVSLSVQQYITEQKMVRAKQLLRNHASLAVSTIALMCGYSDIHYFYRAFRKTTGTTPVQYRQQST